MGLMLADGEVTTRYCTTTDPLYLSGLDLLGQTPGDWYWRKATLSTADDADPRYPSSKLAGNMAI